MNPAHLNKDLIWSCCTGCKMIKGRHATCLIRGCLYHVKPLPSHITQLTRRCVITDQHVLHNRHFTHTVETNKEVSSEFDVHFMGWFSKLPAGKINTGATTIWSYLNYLSICLCLRKLSENQPCIHYKRCIPSYRIDGTSSYQYQLLVTLDKLSFIMKS